jgi:hypothetical protein
MGSRINIISFFYVKSTNNIIILFIQVAYLLDGVAWYILLAS